MTPLVYGIVFVSTVLGLMALMALAARKWHANGSWPARRLTTGEAAVGGLLMLVGQPIAFRLCADLAERFGMAVFVFSGVPLVAGMSWLMLRGAQSDIARTAAR